MPLECPGAEEDYPPSDSIEAHRLIVEAKNLILPLAEDGDVQFQVTNQSKEAVADTYVRIKNLDYVTDVKIETIEEKNINFVIENGKIVFPEEDLIRMDLYPYNYSTYTDTYIIYVTIKDPNYVSGTVELDSAVPSDEESGEVIVTDEEVLE